MESLFQILYAPHLPILNEIIVNSEQRACNKSNNNDNKNGKLYGAGG